MTPKIGKQSLSVLLCAKLGVTLWLKKTTEEAEFGTE